MYYNSGLKFVVTRVGRRQTRLLFGNNCFTVLRIRTYLSHVVINRNAEETNHAEKRFVHLTLATEWLESGKNIIRISLNSGIVYCRFS